MIRQDKEALQGEAKLVLVSIYLKRGQTPDGFTDFRFKASEHEFPEFEL